jgi:hypothetical protein
VEFRYFDDSLDDGLLEGFAIKIRQVGNTLARSISSCSRRSRKTV